MCRGPGTSVRLHAVAIYFRSERENGSWSRRCGFHLRERNFFGGNFSERVIGIQQEVAFSLPRLLCEIIRLWVTLLDQDRQNKSRKNHGNQNSRCKPPSIAIESSDNVICVG